MERKNNLVDRVKRYGVIATIVGMTIGGVVYLTKDKEPQGVVVTGTPIALYDTDRDRTPDYATAPYIYKEDGNLFYQPAKKREPTKEEKDWFKLFGNR